VENININEVDKKIEDLGATLVEYENVDLCKGCDEPKLQHCCNVMVEHKTHLNTPSFCYSKIHSAIKIDVKIEKVCAGTIIIIGVIHKILQYKAILKNGTINSCYKKYFDIPFTCFINTDEASEDDEYEVTGHDFCTYSKNTDINNECACLQKSRCLHIEKILIKICVMRK